MLWVLLQRHLEDDRKRRLGQRAQSAALRILWASRLRKEACRQPFGYVYVELASRRLGGVEMPKKGVIEYVAPLTR